MGVHTKGKHRIGTCVLVLLVWLTPGSFAMDFVSNEGDSFGNSKSKVQLLELTESAWQVFSFAFLSLCRLKWRPFALDYTSIAIG